MRQLFYASAIALLTLAGCQKVGPGVVHDQHTGKSVTHSASFPISGGLLYNVNAMATHSNQNGYSVVVDHLATGGNWMFFREAWSYGRQFTYVVGERRVLGCGGGCSLFENGAIRLSEADFRQAGHTGFTFRLIGSGGAVEGSVPPEAFRQVLTQLGR